MRYVSKAVDLLLAGFFGIWNFFIRFFGAIFSTVLLGTAFSAIMIGAVLAVYSIALPGHDELSAYAPKTISRIYSSRGRLIDEFAEERRLFVAADDIPDLVKAAFISAEDKNFYTHGGYDLRGMVAAARDAFVSRGRNLRGASTITQQVAKNFLLDGSRSVERKAKEIILATRIEASLSKDQILELYLNEIFLGQNSFGVAAAAQTYFNKTLDQLLPEEAAYLAVLPKAPSTYHPVRQSDRAVDRRNFVLKEMFENGYLTQAAYDHAREQPLKSVQNGDFERFSAVIPPRDYPTDEVRRQLSRDFGQAEFFTGGYSVRTTIDPEMQVLAAKSLRQSLEEYDRDQGIWRGTGLSIEPGLVTDDAWRPALASIRLPRDIETNAPWFPAVVLSHSGNDAVIGIEGIEGGQELPANDITWAASVDADGNRSRKARAVSDLMDVGDIIYVRRMTKDSDGSFIRWTARQIPEVQGAFMAMDVNTGRVIAMQGGFSYQHSVFNRATQAQRQPGSSFKPFVYAAALDSGFSPATIVVDAPITVRTPQGTWRPKNASNRFYGPTPVRTGIEQSRNLMTIRLAQEVGMDVIAAYAEKFGVYDRMTEFLSASLGSDETTLYKMVAAYAMFANGGERVEPTLVDRVQNRHGETVFRHDQRVCNDCLNPVLADGQLPIVISQRERVMDAITAYQLTSMMRGVVQRGTARSVRLPVPVAGKTGTTNDSKDVWFVGFTSNIVAGCYIGFDQPKSLGRGASGGGTCGPVFSRFMNEAIKQYGGGNFDVPPGGTFIKIDRFSGARLPSDASGDHVVSEYFREGEEPIFGITFDGGFAMGANLPLFDDAAPETVQEVTTSDGNTVTLGGTASFGSLSSGGLY